MSFPAPFATPVSRETKHWHYGRAGKGDDEISMSPNMVLGELRRRKRGRLGCIARINLTLLAIC